MPYLSRPPSSVFKSAIAHRLPLALSIGALTCIAGVTAEEATTLGSRVAGPLPIQQLRRFTESYARIMADYIEAPVEERLFTGCINGMSRSLDPYSRYLGEMSGLARDQREGSAGLRVAERGGVLRVSWLAKDGPARRAGVRLNDILIKAELDGVVGRSPQEIGDFLVSKVGGWLTLYLMHPKEDAPVQIRMQLELLAEEGVISRVITPGVAYIGLPRLNADITKDTIFAVQEMFRSGRGPDGLILDLRGNPGGILRSAIDVASIFLPPATSIASTKGRTPDANVKFVAFEERNLPTLGTGANLPPKIKTVPMVVLVDGETASGAELIATALQENSRAKIFGTKSHGIATIQTIFPIDHQQAAIKLTTAKFVSPQGISIEGIGVKLDSEFQEKDAEYAIAATSKGDKKDVILAMAVKYLSR